MGRNKQPQTGDYSNKGKQPIRLNKPSLTTSFFGLQASRTYFCDSEGKIHCLPGWTDEHRLCQTPICAINGQTCVHGNCSKPYTCECEIGW